MIDNIGLITECFDGIIFTAPPPTDWIHSKNEREPKGREGVRKEGRDGHREEKQSHKIRLCKAP